jgi:hypothetical protein
MPIKPLLAGSLTGAILAGPIAPGGPTATMTGVQWWLINPLTLSADAPLAPSSQPAPQQATTRETEPDWVSHLTRNAQALSELQAGWDGHSSIPISRKLLYRATSYVESALKGLSNVTPPRLVPGGDGSVQIEWHAIHGELEFDIGPHDEMTIWIRDRRNGAEFQGENQAALALFYRWAPWIASRLRHDSDATAQAQMPMFSVAA